MSVKKSKVDLLVRVRYSNPLPAPPCPPKLLEIPTNPMRYARPEFLDALANETPLPMIVDAECGMPLDLSQYQCLWEEDADDSALNPDPDNLPQLDPEDALLLSDASATPASFTNGNHVGSLPMHVPWLRKTEYISREVVQRAAATQEPRLPLAHAIDVSRAAQLQTIEASFAASNPPPGVDAFDLSTLRHPTKRHLTAVDSYEVFPDAEIWSNAYDLFRFWERPGERPVDVEDLRLDCAILRPMESDGDHFLAYYLTKDDESAISFKERRAQTAGVPPGDEPPPSEPTAFYFVRDYETVKVEQDVSNEFLLVVDEGEEDGVIGVDGNPKRGKGAYYKNIERKMNLKKKRGNIHEIYDQKWEVINITHGAMAAEELAEREEALAEVLDPDFLLNRDAEGEPDLELEQAKLKEDGKLE